MTHRIALPDGFAERWPRGDRLGTQLIMNVVLTGELAVTRIARLTRHLGVSSAGGLTLSILSEAGALSPSQISDRLIVTRAAVTNVIDSLESKGFVRRLARSDDRRSYLVEVTRSGRRVADELRDMVHPHEKTWTDVLSSDEKRKLIEMLERIQARFDELPIE